MIILKHVRKYILPDYRLDDWGSIPGRGKEFFL
jgi:hypothetical protein